jgi:NAD(P)H-flavin reductase
MMTATSKQFPLELSVTHSQRHGPRIRSFFMTPRNGARPNFVAGQVAVLALGDAQPVYIAFASGPEEPEFEFLIKRNKSQEGMSALFDPHFAEPVRLREIVGTGFPVEDYKGHDLVFVAMGTGLAPLRSVLHHIFNARDEYGRLVVLYGARTLEDLCYQDEINNVWRARGVELRQVLSQPGASEWSGPTGYVQSLLDHLVPELQQPVALVCGSSEMMAQTKERLLALGFTAEKILTNY